MGHNFRLRSPFLVFLFLLACPNPSTEIQEGSSCSAAGSVGCLDAGVLGYGRVLVCQSSKWTVYSDCRGNRGCTIQEDATLVCDTSGNTEGDHCAPPSEGKARCDPQVAASILRCNGGMLQKVAICDEDAGLRCLPVDGGLSCQ